MKNWIIASTVAAMLGISASAKADTINGTVGAGWQSWTAANVNNNGTPYWDNRSGDGLDRNIGDMLTGAHGNTDLASPPGALPFWGNSFNSALDSGGSADSSVTFARTSASSSATLSAGIAGYFGSNTIGWYDTANPSILHPILSGSQGIGASTSFSPSASYGLYFTDGGIGQTWFSQAGLNTPGQTADQHLAIFRDGRGFVIGGEDLPLRGSDKDFNDLVIQVSPSTTPEPGSMALLALGLGLIGTIAWKRESLEIGA